jgi:DNA-binding CsgD family transcriptional regulator
MDAPGASAVTGLLERERECERIERAVDAAAAGAGSVVALEGEAGIGKTALLAHAIVRGRAQGMRVLRARGGELEREFAYGVVRQLFEAPLVSATQADRERWLAGAAALAAPVLSLGAPLGGSGPDATATLHALYWLAANLSVEQPLVIAVDDAHWADEASNAFVSYLARRVDELAIVVVYGSRVGEGASEEQPAVAEPGLVGTVLRPASLSRSATARLVERWSSQTGSQPFALACHAATSGNPFLLTQLLTALDADGVQPADANAEHIEQIASQTIARATIARLRRLGPAANELALSVAVLGTSAELRHAAALARLGGDEAADAADVLVAAAILRDRRPLEFIHPIVRTAVYNEIAPARRAASHKRAARLLDDDDAGGVALAPHLLASECSGDPWVVERLRGAAQEVLERGAAAAACTYLERAHREPPPPGARAGVLLALGTAEHTLMRPVAIDHLRTVLETAPDSQTRLLAAHELVYALAYSGRVRDAVALCEEWIPRDAADDGAADANERALRLQGLLAATAQFAPSFASEALERLASLAGTPSGATLGERMVLACLAYRVTHRGDGAAEAARLAELALAGGSLIHDTRPEAANGFLAVWSLVYADRLAEAERYFDIAIERARACGRPGAFGGASASRCQLLVRQGRLAAAEAEALGLLAQTSPHAIARPMLLACLLETMVERSDPGTWEPFLVEHGIDGDVWDAPMAERLLFSRGHMRLAGGDPRAALGDFEQLRRLSEISGLDTPARPCRGSQALALAALGEPDQARALAAEEFERARRWDTPSSLAFALRAAAQVERGPRAVELLRESVACVAGSPAAYERALSLTDLGAALRRQGLRRDALDTLREALDAADGCGALRLARRARDELVAGGARPRRAALSGRDALTPSERRVAQLAAEGLSNREIAQTLFVTMRTVEGHLTQSYAKLDISSRDGLGAALTTRRPTNRP